MVIIANRRSSLPSLALSSRAPFHTKSISDWREMFAVWWRTAYFHHSSSSSPISLSLEHRYDFTTVSHDELFVHFIWSHGSSTVSLCSSSSRPSSVISLLSSSCWHHNVVLYESLITPISSTWPWLISCAHHSSHSPSFHESNETSSLVHSCASSCPFSKVILMINMKSARRQRTKSRGVIASLEGRTQEWPILFCSINCSRSICVRRSFHPDLHQYRTLLGHLSSIVDHQTSIGQTRIAVQSDVLDFDLDIGSPELSAEFRHASTSSSSHSTEAEVCEDFFALRQRKRLHDHLGW